MPLPLRRPSITAEAYPDVEGEEEEEEEIEIDIAIETVYLVIISITNRTCTFDSTVTWLGPLRVELS